MRSSWPEFSSASRVTGIPEFSEMTSAFRQSPKRMTGTPLNFMFIRANTASIAKDSRSTAIATQSGQLPGKGISCRARPPSASGHPRSRTCSRLRSRPPVA